MVQRMYEPWAISFCLFCGDKSSIGQDPVGKGIEIMNILGQIDQGILWLLQALRQEWMNPFWKMVTSLGNSGWFWIVTALALVLCARTRRTGATMLLAMVLGALVTNVLLKPWVGRVRPYDTLEWLVPVIGPQRDASFPSGHSCAAFATAIVGREQLPWPYGILLVVLAGLVAFSRLYLGVHYPSDVLAGILIGIAAARTAMWIMGKRELPDAEP